LSDKLLPADVFIVYKKQMLNDNDRNILILLYQPIIGAEALNLYLTLWAFLDGVLISKEKTHHYLMSVTHLNIEKIINGRQKLEAVGLLKTFFKKKSTNCYLYELFAPLTPNDFFQNPILSATLKNHIGDEEYNRLTQLFISEQVDLSDFKDISKNFQEVFQIVDYHTSEMECLKRESGQLSITNGLDVEGVLATISDDILNHKLIGASEKTFIKHLSYIYDLNEEILKELIISSVNQYKKIDLLKLRKKSEKLFQYENEGHLPKIALKTQPENLRKNPQQVSKRNQIIHVFETTSPRDFLLGKNDNSIISQNEQKILAYLLLDLKLNPGVVNVLIDYVLRINNNKLVKNFVTTIASQWKKEKITTVEEAMNIAEREFKQRKNYQKDTKQKTKAEKIPDWFHQNIESKAPSKEEQAEIEKMLEEYR